MRNSPLRIAIVAGEASGDVLAAGVIKSLKKRYPDAIFEGIAGTHMQAAGCKTLFDIEILSVMGLVEVLSSIRPILKVKNQLIEYFTDNPPDVYVGVDAPDFNLRVETALKAKGIKTVHYVSPTVWAWREKRIFKIAKATNRVLGIFPFEQDVYDKYQVPYSFVGHTMADIIPIVPDQNQARNTLGLSTELPCLAVLPGSRGGEVAKLLPVFTATVEQLWQHKPQCQVVIPAANERRLSQITAYLKEHRVEWLDDSRVFLLNGQSRESMIASDVILLASGTATLEAMLCKRPMVSAYLLSWLTHKMMMRMYKPDYFSLPNILANEALIPELLQEEVNPDRLCAELMKLFESDTTALTARFVELHQSLKQNADERAADAVMEVINE
ncbi:lipid-A-disaccharide synthase [Alteromonas lipolytica]|uniref:Lipid-A-disaccharide synthase n=1 Tax=Alteromonas lipolytica TaxID=1856405 RepID=A0A1E8FE95_9ALTE|nr:lipid-A-disaccharide synthase [Alteromonas lipolytica]OFI34240.1 lipid-A-disaccharide synthase [Alteromonas lipolytica]GGF83803.1 lipid-A-disaccharide synthase [Alteromonas lipolytica]